MSFRPLSITAASALTPAGGLVQTCAAIRAGIARRREHAYFHALSPDPEWTPSEPLVAAVVDAIDPMIDGRERLMKLLVPTLGDLLDAAALKRRDLAECALLLALPAPDEAVAGWRLDETFAADLCRRTGLSFKTVRHRTSGHTGVFELLGEASAVLAANEAEACIVIGVDSHLSGDRMELLDAGYRLKSARNVDGFCPGEAAVALLVESPRRIRARSARVRAKVVALGLGEETETALASDKASTGRGLTAALRGALPADGSAQWILCDLNGESYRAFEWGTVLARLGPRLAGIRRLVMPVMSVGDLGAATGALLVAAAAEAFERGYAPAHEAVLWTASDGAIRAAARVTEER